MQGQRHQLSLRKKQARKVAAAAHGSLRPPLAPVAVPPQPTEEEPIFTVRETARILQRSEQTIRNWINAGRLHATNVGEPDKPTYRIFVAEIERTNPFAQPKDGGGDKAA
jgi:hypothetical protein